MKKYEIYIKANGKSLKIGKVECENIKQVNIHTLHIDGVKFNFNWDVEYIPIKK